MSQMSQLLWHIICDRKKNSKNKKSALIAQSCVQKNNVVRSLLIKTVSNTLKSKILLNS